jgi:hypothetical protein
MTLGVPARIGQWRRTVGVAAVVAGALTATALTSTGTSAAQAPAFGNGRGSAIAESYRFDPVAGGLSFGVGVGEALAGHQNTLGVAESRAVNTGVIGTTLAAPGSGGGDPTLAKENQPQPLRTDSNEEGAADGVSEEDPNAPGIQRQVRATHDPFAEAITSTQTQEIPGVMTIGPTIARTTSGVIDGSYREATATTDISFIEIAGAIRLEGLHWESFHRTGSQDEHGGSFTIAGASIAGAPIPTDDPTATLAQLNDVLRPLGAEFRPPTYHEDRTSGGTLATVDSMAIALIPATSRDSLLGPLFSAIQPARQSLFQAMIDADCSTASLITVLDVVFNATGAGGEFSIQLGGTQATTAAIDLFQLGSLPPLPPLSSTGVASGTSGSTSTGSSSGSGTVSAPSTGTAAPAAATSAPAADDTTASPIAAFVGERGGPMLGVGLAGLLGLLAAAEGDRRKMRRAQREIPLPA